MVFKKRLQRGLTLIELSIIGLFLGILAIFTIIQFSGSASDSTKSSALYEISSNLADNWALLNMTCNTTLDASANPIAGGTASNVRSLGLLLGALSPASAYQSCYSASGVKGLAGLAQGDVTNGFSAQGYALGIAVTGKVMTVTFTGVPDNLILPLYNKYSSVAGAKSAGSLPATADVSDAAIQFTAVSGGVRDLKILRQM